jgi:hypothetical protein
MMGVKILSSCFLCDVLMLIGASEQLLVSVGLELWVLICYIFQSN